MKNRIMPLTILLVILLSSSFAFAYPVFQLSDGVNYDIMMFENVETWIDNQDEGDEGYGDVSVGDQFYGILSVQNIKYGIETSASEIWSASNSGTIDSFTAYFAATVEDVEDLGGGDYRIYLEPGDYLERLTGDEVFAFYVDDDADDATGFTTNQTVATDIDNATDGDLWATFGLVDDDNDYWYTEAPVTPPGSGHEVGMSFGGLSLMQDNTNMEFLSINDPIEDFMDTWVDFYFRSYLGQTIDVVSGDGSEWYFVSNDPAGFKPIPEPATMLLLGSGLIGLAGFGRKKKFFKKD